MNNDFYFSNRFIAQIGGTSEEELNQMELKFLKIIDFEAHIKEEIYLKIKSLAECFIADKSFVV